MKEIAITLDCNACKSEKTMQATKIPRFNTIIQFIGVILLIPFFIGIIVLFTVFTSIHSSGTGAPGEFGSGIVFGLLFFVGILLLVSGLLGWILLMRRKVFKCTTCGYILDRD